MDKIYDDTDIAINHQEIIKKIIKIVVKFS
jgi:hypothetical protein